MGYTKKQVNEITGLPMRSIQYYTERMLVIPEDNPGEGRGKTRKYSKKNLVEFGVIKALADYGMAFAQLKSIFETINFARNHGGIEKPFITIYKVESGSGFVCQYSNILHLDEHYGSVAESMLIINIGKIFERVTTA